MARFELIYLHKLPKFKCCDCGKKTIARYFVKVTETYNGRGKWQGKCLCEICFKKGRRKMNTGCARCDHIRTIGMRDGCKKLREKLQTAISGMYSISGDCEKINKDLDCIQWTPRRPFWKRILGISAPEYKK